MMHCRWFCSMLLGGLGLLGCDMTRPTPESDLPEFVQPAKADVVSEKAPAAATQAKSPPATASAEPEFAAPFPPRENPFTLPPRGPQPLVSKLPGVSETPLRIELKGFVSLDATRAVLTIDGEIVSLGVGEEHRSVKVLTLAPPQVTLQRGRYRWTESLDAAEPASK